MSNEELIKTTIKPILWTSDAIGKGGKLIHCKEPISKEKALELINDPIYSKVEVIELHGKVHVQTYATSDLW